MDFNTLFSFRERFNAEVGGRGIPQPPAEIAVKLLRFAGGECDAVERTEVCEILRQNPPWLRWLADRVRRNREATQVPPVTVE